MILLGTGDSVDMMELFNLVPVREAFRDGHWLMPTLNGVPRFEKPPLAVWLPAGFASVFGSDSLFILRLPAALCGILTAMATYGIGCLTLRDRCAALISAITLLTMIVFLRHARLASYDVFSTAFLSVGVWGFFGLAEASARRAVWAVLAGVGIGLSLLAKGPVPVATICFPLGVWLLIFHRRPAVWGWLAVAAMVSIAVFTAWAVPALLRYPEAWSTWVREIWQNSSATSNNPAQTAADLKRPIHYYLQFFGWVAPHVPFFVAALVLPFMKDLTPPSADAAARRRARWAFWGITLGGLLVLTLLAEKKPRYAMPLFPFAALMCGAVWQAFLQTDPKAKLDLGTKVLLTIQIAVFAAVGAGMLLAASLCEWVNNEAILRATDFHLHIGKSIFSLRPALSGVFEVINVAPLWATLGMGAVLIVVSLNMVHALRQGAFARAAAGAMIASVALVLGLQTMYRSFPANYTNPIRPLAQNALARANGQPVYTISGYRPWLSTLFYANRILPQLTPLELKALSQTRTAEPIYLLLIVPKDAPAAGLDFDPSRSPAIIYSYDDEQGNRTLLYQLPAMATR